MKFWYIAPIIVCNTDCAHPFGTVIKVEITLDNIAAYVHLSRVYFHNLFLAAAGQMPYGYLLSKRISAVKFLPTATDKPFPEIALDCGFFTQIWPTSLNAKQPVRLDSTKNSYASFEEDIAHF